MQDPQKRSETLEEQVALLQQRVTALEALLSPLGLDPPLSERVVGIIRPSESESANEAGQAVEGTLNYSASARFAQGGRYLLKHQMSLARIFQEPPEQLASVFAALANPHRIVILQKLCQGPCSSQQLQELLGTTSVGQLYHHLKELQTAGLISGRGRNAYTLERRAVIPICMALMIASQLAFPDQQGTQDLATRDEGQTEVEPT